MMRTLLLLTVAVWLTVSPAAADESRRELLKSIGEPNIDRLTRSGVGVTRRQTVIWSLVDENCLDLAAPQTRLLILGGLDGSPGSVRAVMDALTWFYQSGEAAPWREKFVVSAIPCANPDGLLESAGVKNASGGEPGKGYPPQDKAYQSRTSPENAYLWRWIGMSGADLLIDVRKGDAASWHVGASGLISLPSPRHDPSADELAFQVARQRVCETGSIPAVQVRIGDGSPSFLPTVLEAMESAGAPRRSNSRAELVNRLNRSPVEVAEQLTRHYGHDLKRVMYQPALSLVARLRLGELTGERRHLTDVERITAPWLSKPAAAPQNGSEMAGHLIFCELAGRADDQRRAQCIRLAKAAAAAALDEDGQPRESAPYHHEMSDSVFMAGPLLASVARLTGEEKYADACVNHQRFMRKLVQRDDGICRHSPLCEAAWGRGNGFVALGLAWTLSEMSPQHSAYPELRDWLRVHLESLAKHQDATGPWRQVIDEPGAYRELTSTCMITFAMIRAARKGWIDRDRFAPVIEKSWRAILLRTPPNGRLVDVCTGTGKQRSLQDYYERAAILGSDERGGAMALMAAAEMACWRN